MFRSRRDNTVARLQQSMQHNVETVGPVVRKNDAIGLRRIEQGRHQPTGAVDDRSRLLSTTATASPGSSSVISLPVVDRSVNRLRLGPTRRGVVQVNRLLKLVRDLHNIKLLSFSARLGVGWMIPTGVDALSFQSVSRIYPGHSSHLAGSSFPRRFLSDQTHFGDHSCNTVP